MADAISDGITPTENAARICAEILSSALASSAEIFSTADSIIGSQRFDSTNARYASVEIINPRGTWKPARARRARFAPFPPAVSRVISGDEKGKIDMKIL